MAYVFLMEGQMMFPEMRSPANGSYNRERHTIHGRACTCEEWHHFFEQAGLDIEQ
jgi:hypothetical protein